ncbi:MAG TPA: HAD-IB family phosphatase [Oscillospiraceae bacterium]|jgi:HAD superfamily phosphoserine phosphatase-like hydrolase|nr:HAD-IB family phosphatase [Oscillospiraceae bacterium]
MNVYDFDDTIYRGESSLHLFLFYMKKDPKLIRMLPQMLIGLIKYKLRLVSIDKLLNDYAAPAEEYFKNIDNIQDDIKEFWDKNMHRVKPFYFTQQKEDDLIISASPEFYLKELFDRIGIKNYLGTVVNTQTGKVEFVCYRENKVKAFYERYPEGVIENFYTDSYNDQALMDIAENVFFVKGDKIKQIKP